MAAQMECAGRAWCDFVSFDDRLPEPLQYRCVRIERDDKKICEMMAGITAFLDELDELEAEMLEQIKKFCVEHDATPRHLAKMIDKVTRIIGDEDYDDEYLRSILELEFPRTKQL